MMQFVMQPGMVYQYPLWGVALLLVGLSALGAMLVDLAVHQFLSIELRRRHNDVAAAIFSVVGVTFAVLLAFVAMLAWEGFNRAKAAAYAEAAAVLDVYNAAIGLTGPQASQMPDAVIGYLETVVRVEWPAQAEGQIVDRGKAFLEAEHVRDRSQTLRCRGRQPSRPVAAIPGPAAGRETAKIVGCRNHHSRGRLDRDIGWLGPHDCFRLFPRRSESRHASCHVRPTGDFRSVGADPDHRAQQPVPRRFSGVDAAVRSGLDPNSGVEDHRSMTMSLVGRKCDPVTGP
jgi:hypothetical protein